MNHLALFAGVLLLAAPAGRAASALPFVPAEAAVIERLMDREKDLGPTVRPAGKPNARIVERLASLGVPTANLQVFELHVPSAPQRVLSLLYGPDQRIVAIRGNGPWLRNETLADLVNLPELRILSIDHNGDLKATADNNPFDGAGLAALASSQLAVLEIGLGFSDRGMAAAAGIGSLRQMRIAHSRVTGAGIEPFTRHEGITAFSIAEMATPRVKEGDLATVAKIPKLARVGFKECLVTYYGGLVHLKPLAGRLEEIDLRMCVIPPADLERLRADHPKATILASTFEEIAKTHRGIATALARQAPPELAAPLRAAIDALPKSP